MRAGFREPLVKIGRARLALVLPRCRDQLRSLEDPYFDDLFESYALAAMKLEKLLYEQPRQDDLVSEYKEICLDVQAEVASMLERFRKQQAWRC